MKQHADYLLLGGTVIDPVCERSFRADVAVGSGRILAIGTDLAYEAAKTLDVSGCYVTPVSSTCIATAIRLSPLRMTVCRPSIPTHTCFKMV